MRAGDRFERPPDCALAAHRGVDAPLECADALFGVSDAPGAFHKRGREPRPIHLQLRDFALEPALRLGRRRNRGFRPLQLRLALRLLGRSFRAAPRCRVGAGRRSLLSARVAGEREQAQAAREEVRHRPVLQGRILIPRDGRDGRR